MRNKEKQTGLNLSFWTRFLAAVFAAVLIIAIGTDEYPLTDVQVKVAFPVVSEDAPMEAVVAWADANGLWTCPVTTSDIDPADYDALIVPGGADIYPAYYGERPLPDNSGQWNPKFDKIEIELVRKFADAGKPILGICRGAQLINVALGGTLVQHIPGSHQKNRDIVLSPNDWLYDGENEKATVYHIHHQCIEELGEGLAATEWDAADGRIEGFVHTSLPIYGVQWHPEFSDDMMDKVADWFKYIVWCEKTGNIS